MPRHQGPWTEDEEAVLRRYYPRGGAAACVPHLPHRSYNAIQSRVGSLGLRLDPDVLRHQLATGGLKGAQAVQDRAVYDHRALAQALGMAVDVPPSLACLPSREHRLLGGM